MIFIVIDKNTKNIGIFDCSDKFLQIYFLTTRILIQIIILLTKPFKYGKYN